MLHNIGIILVQTSLIKAKIYEEKYRRMASRKIHIAGLMMVKNEHKCLRITLNSLIGHVDSLVVFDTGSTDDTVDILKEFSKESGIPLRLKVGEFVDFSTSRNVSLDFADTFPDIDYLLLLDCNDQLQGGDKLREECKKYLDSESTGFMVKQEWLSNDLIEYFNIRLVKAHSGWRYRGAVHEWMKNTAFEDGKEPPVPNIDKAVTLFQNRNEDDNKTYLRFSRDKELLISDHKKDPKEPRTLFYLAQTCACLKQWEDAFYYYKLRIKEQGFWEERFQACLRCAEAAEKLGHDWYSVMKWYIQSLEYCERAEPLIKLAEYYISKNIWHLAYHFISYACTLDYPSNCVLFVNKRDYNYTRWHLLGRVAYYHGKYQEGKEGCLRAIEEGTNVGLDRLNLQFYLDKEKHLNNSKKIPEISKKDFISQKLQEITSQNPNISRKQALSKAKKLWSRK